MIENSKIAIIGISALVSQVSLLHGYNKVKSQTLTPFLHWIRKREQMDNKSKLFNKWCRKFYGEKK